MDREVLRKWLKCGFVFNGELFPTEEGTPQGGIISPTLANMTLDGLQSLVQKAVKPHWEPADTKYGRKWIEPKINLVRYADDFIVTAKDKGNHRNGSPASHTAVYGRAWADVVGRKDQGYPCQ